MEIVHLNSSSSHETKTNNTYSNYYYNTFNNNNYNNNTYTFNNNNHPSLIHMPVDIFIEICNNLPPQELFNLMYLCRKFYYWLNSTNSYMTQNIWRNSRKFFDKYMKLDPPMGMDEISYINLLMIEKRCQICKSDHETPKIYWSFRVRLCSNCFNKNIIIAENIPDWYKDPIDITLVLPHEYLNIQSRNIRNITKNVYLISELNSTFQECLLIPPNELGDWIFNKQIIARNKIKDISDKNRLENDDNRLKFLLEKKKNFLNQILKKFEKFDNDIIDLSGKKIFLTKHILSLPNYKKVKNTLNNPFMDIDPWINLFEKLKFDCKPIILKQNRKLIINRIIQLITSYRNLSSFEKNRNSIFLNDPILDCLEWCPSFINPPDFTTDLDDLVKRLRIEARNYLKIHKRRHGPFSTIKGSINLCNTIGIRLFKCKLCWGSGRKSYNYDEVSRHLTCQSTHNLYYSDIDVDSMIEIDREKVKRLVSLWLKKVVLKNVAKR